MRIDRHTHIHVLDIPKGSSAHAFQYTQYTNTYTVCVRVGVYQGLGAMLKSINSQAAKKKRWSGARRAHVHVHTHTHPHPHNIGNICGEKDYSGADRGRSRARDLYNFKNLHSKNMHTHAQIYECVYICASAFH